MGSLPPAVTAVILWNDDMEPNTQAKQDRQSVNVLTATLVTRITNNHSFSTTTVISLGSKDSDHEPVFCRLTKDLEMLSDSTKPIKMYHAGTNCIVPVVAVPYVVLVDFAARAGISGLTSHSGKFSKVWDFAGDVCVHDSTANTLML